ncbi:MAG: hypothetical protein HZB59_01305 [Ignavibacteriales bacterium]|nr:hypothetical protein [Ignavibacteriales bacterium]
MRDRSVSLLELTKKKNPLVAADFTSARASQKRNLSQWDAFGKGCGYHQFLLAGVSARRRAGETIQYIYK